MLELSQYLTTNNMIESQRERQHGTGTLKDKEIKGVEHRTLKKTFIVTAIKFQQSIIREKNPASSTNGSGKKAYPHT